MVWKSPRTWNFSKKVKIIRTLFFLSLQIPWKFRYIHPSYFPHFSKLNQLLRTKLDRSLCLAMTYLNLERFPFYLSASNQRSLMYLPTIFQLARKENSILQIIKMEINFYQKEALQDGWEPQQIFKYFPNIAKTEIPYVLSLVAVLNSCKFVKQL